MTSPLPSPSTNPFANLPANLPFTFKRAQEIPPANALSQLIYGQPGTGKSFYAGTAGDRTLYINCGRSEETILSAFFRQRVGANPILVNIREKAGENGVPASAIGYDLVCDAIDYGLKNFPDEFDTVVVDDATFLRKYALNKGIEVNSTLGKSKTAGSIKQFAMQMASVQDYGAEMSLIEQFVVNYGDILKGMNKHFILIAHERNTFRKGDKIGDSPTLIKCGPAFTGQTFPDQIPAYFDHVFHTESIPGNGGVNTYRMRTVGDDVLVGKCRHGNIIKTLELNPNFLEFVDRIRKSHVMPK
jgi:hypothetical protein